ncbi:MAG: SUMF1/EgtB/PvdO family nonheme iron enzyme [Cyclobacteriaceae bacterium]
MKDIPGGTFTMGNNSLTGSPEQKAAAPEHQVTLTAYSLSEAEITNSQYAEFLTAAFADGLVEIVTGTSGPDNGLSLVQGTSTSAYDGKVLYNLDGIRVLKDHENNADGNSFTGEVEPENPLNISYIGFDDVNDVFYVKDPHDVNDFHWEDICDYQDYSETNTGQFEGPILNDFDDWSGAGQNLSDELEGWTENNPAAATKLPDLQTVSEWPVTFVRWWGAWAFADYYDLTLPTEAQWENAAKAGQNYNYAVHDGSDVADANWNQDDLPTATGHVRSAISGTANPFGLYNMAGNCWEWIADNYEEPYSTDAVTDPLIEDPSSTLRCWRGGSWNYHEATLQSAIRFSDEEDRGNDHFGFRVAGAHSSTTGAIWDGSEGSSWSNPDNWSGGAVPTYLVDVSIPTTDNDPVIDADASVNDIDIADGVTVTVESGGSLAILGTHSGDGLLAVERNTTGSGGYSIVGTPVTGAVVNDLQADYLYEYFEPNENFTVPTGMMLPCKGYFVGFDAASPVVTLTGSPNTGTKSIMVTNALDGFNLIANPYAAAISIESFLANTQNSSILDGTVYFWDDGGQNFGNDRGGDYITTNGMGTVGTIYDLGDGINGNQGTTAAENGYITSLQGFFVNTSETGDVQFTSDMQVTTAGANSDANHYRKLETSRSTIKLALSNGNYAQEILVGMSETATAGRDNGIDALRLSRDAETSFYSFIDSEHYVIQGIPFVQNETGKMSVLLGYELAQGGSYAIEVVDTQDLLDQYLVTLIDTEMDKNILLNENNAYSFEESTSGAYKRFELQFSLKETLGNSKKQTKDLTVYGTPNGISIQANLNGPQDVAVHNLTGQLVYSEEIMFQNNSAQIIHSLNINEVYIMQVGAYKVKFILNK